MNLSAWLSIAALFVTSASAVTSLVKESQERREKHEKPRRWHWHLRLALAVVGFVAGVTLIGLNAATGRVSEARHSQEREVDRQRIAGLNQAIETQIHDNETQYLRHQQELHGLRDEVTELKKDIATRDLRKKMESLQARLDKSLAPRPRARLEASFWQSGIQDEIIPEIYAPVEGNVVSFSFSIANRTDVSAKDVSLWIRICDACKFHGEPEQSRFVPGAPAVERLYLGINLPPGARWQKLTVELEVPPRVEGRLEIATRYRCDECAVEKDWQKLWITLGRIPVPAFRQTPQPKKKAKPRKP